MNSQELATRFLNFASLIINLDDQLEKSFAGKHIYRQLMRSSSSCGANYEETIAAESHADFSHKLQIVLKEIRESNYWLKLLQKSDLVNDDTVNPLIQESIELINIVSKSVKTIKSKRNH